MARNAEIVAARERKMKAGHYEVVGETLAKFEFFQHGWHPYSRFLDIEKIDLILRRRTGSRVEYREVQVKYGKLYPCIPKWEVPLFSVTSWRFFTESEIASLADRPDIYLAYVLSPDDGFKGDLFIFRIGDFAKAMRSAHRVGSGKYRVYISRSVADPSRWYVRRQARFGGLTPETAFEVTQHYRDFGCLET